MSEKPDPGLRRQERRPVVLRSPLCYRGGKRCLAHYLADALRTAGTLS